MYMGCVYGDPRVCVYGGYVCVWNICGVSVCDMCMEGICV